MRGRINRIWKRKVGFCVLGILLGMSVSGYAADSLCPGVNDPAPLHLRADVPALMSVLSSMKDVQGRSVWQYRPESDTSLRDIFESVPPKTKLEEFFQLLFHLQQGIEKKDLPLAVTPPGITDALLSARVFKTPDFPQKITRVELLSSAGQTPHYQVFFVDQEVRFPINEGKGFATWDQGMCQIAKELVFYPGFSFRLRKAHNSKNLIVDDFEKVQIYGQFGTRKIVSIDMNYVDLEKVEFIAGTDQGKVTARVSQREFRENPHSFLFRFIGSLIPNTSQQRIDW